MSLSELNSIFDNRLCSYHNYKTFDKQPECEKLCKIILELKIVDPPIVKNFIDFITRSICLSFGSNNLVQVIRMFINCGLIKYNNINNIIKYHQYDSLIRHNDFINLKDIVKHRFYFPDDKSNILVDRIFEYLEMNEENIRILCDCRNEYLAYKLSIVVDKFDGHLDMELLHKAYKNLPFSRYLVNSLHGRNLVFDNKCLISVCVYCSADILDNVLDDTTFEPCVEHFNSIVKECKDDIDSKLRILLKYGYKYTHGDIMLSIKMRIKLPCLDDIEFNKNLLDHCIKYKFFLSSDVLAKKKFEPTVDHFNAFVNNLGNDGPDEVDIKLRLLLKYGYQYTRDDILLSIELRRKLPYIEESGIAFDQEIVDHCVKYNFFPLAEFKSIDQMEQLRLVCKSKRITVIKGLINKYHLKPDNICMINACSFGKEIRVVKYLISMGCVVTFECIKVCLENNPTNAFVKFLWTEYKKQLENIPELEKRITNPKEISNNTETKIKTIVFDYTDDDIVQYKIKYAMLWPIPITLTKILPNISRNSNKTFSDVRKIIEKQKQWIYKYDSGLLDIPDMVKSELGLKDGYIDLADLDKFICLIYDTSR